MSALSVGLNALHLVPRETGGSELYVRRLIPALLEAAPDLELTVFASREGGPSLGAEPWSSSARVVTLPVNARSRPRRVAFEQTGLPLAVRRAGVDLLHNLFSTAPVVPGATQVTTVLDVIYKRFPETHRGVLATGMALLVPLAARRSRRVLAISESGRNDIVEFLGVPAERVDVTPLGPGMAEDIAPVRERELRDRLGLGDRRLVLTLSAKRPHKNLERLIEAVALLSDDAVLVAPGYATSWEDDLHRRVRDLGLEDRVRLPGWLDDSELEGLFRFAEVFVFPSLAEGFGLPVLEAMLRGVPVASSNATSLPEITGDAALLFEPTDVAAIAGAVQRLLDDDALRASLRAAGPERARAFTWAATAARTLESYRRATGGGQ